VGKQNLQSTTLDLGGDCTWAREKAQRRELPLPELSAQQKQTTITTITHSGMYTMPLLLRPNA